MKTKEDNMTLGTLLLGIGAVLLIIWLLKIVLATFLSIAESVLVMGFYIVFFYAVFALLISIYAKMFPNKTPKFVKFALVFHHAVAQGVKVLFKGLRALFFRKKKSNASS